jgi:hypothetical protein
MDQAASPTAGDKSTVQDGQARKARHRHYRILLVGAAAGAVLLAGALTAAWILGASYQPVKYGIVVPDITGPIRYRIVNNFEDMRGQIYIPPQPATHGALLVSLADNGPYPVTIESVSMIANGEPSSISPLNDQTGPATYKQWGPHDWPITASSPKIAGTVLKPGASPVIRIPFSTPTCWQAGRSLVSTFWVTTRFLWWTHTFPVSWTLPYDAYGGAIMSQLPDTNGKPGDPGVFCPRH